MARYRPGSSGVKTGRYNREQEYSREPFFYEPHYSGRAKWIDKGLFDFMWRLILLTVNMTD